MNNLAQMRVLETSAATWFAKMSRKEQQAYIKSHPGSKFATNTSGMLAKHSRALIDETSGMVWHHGQALARKKASPRTSQEGTLRL